MAMRAIDTSHDMLQEMTAGHPGSEPGKNGETSQAIVSAGGCGSSLSQLVLSVDNAVAGIGCDFASWLAVPLLQDP